MSVKLVNDESLTSVANAIRVKGEISGTIEFPDGFVSAIQNLSPSPTLQSKSAAFTPATTIQSSSVTADSGYDGLSEVDVIVNPIPSQYIIPSGTLSVSQNGTVDVTQYANANVNVSGGGSSWELLASREYSFETTLPTTATQIDSFTLPAADVYTKSKIIAGVARKKHPTMVAKEYIGTDCFFINKFSANGQTTKLDTSNARAQWHYLANPTDVYDFAASGFNSSGGVFINTISSDGQITVTARSLNNFFNVIGDYTLDIYALSWPAGSEPFGV